MTTARRHLRDAKGRLGPRARRAGFSLVELILALGVLAIGMAMAAALFPAAIKLNEQSTRDSVGTIIAQNGLAIARAVLTRGDFNSTDPNYPDLLLLRPLDGAAAFQTNPNLLLYQGDPNDGPTTRGFLVLGRSLGTVRQVVIVSYDKCDVASTVAPKLLTVDSPDASGHVVVHDSLGNCTDTFLVWASSSEPNIITVRMKRPDPKRDEWVLDRPIGDITGGQAFVIVENPSNPMAKNPVMVVLVAEIALRD